MAELTQADIRRISGNWYTVPVVTLDQHIKSKVVAANPDGRIVEALYFDLSVSKTDKRDWIISRRSDVFLDQEKGFVSAWTRKGWTIEEMFSELLDLANEAAEQREVAHV